MKLAVGGLPAAIAVTFGGSARSEGGAGRVSARRPKLTLANPIAPATSAALAREASKSKPQVTGAAIALGDRERGAQVRVQCGTETARRTVVVYLLRRAYFPSESLMQGVYFVSRFRSGYRVWEVAH